jgi:hypothetical protein
MEESCNGKYAINYNYKKGKLESIDEGDYQHNSKNHIYFCNKYNEGKNYNPYNTEIARRISRQFLLDMEKETGNLFSALVVYNCGINQWRIKPPLKSIRYAERIMRRIK